MSRQKETKLWVDPFTNNAFPVLPSTMTGTPFDRMKNITLILLISLLLSAAVRAAELEGPGASSATNFSSKENNEIVDTCKWGPSTNGVRMGVALINDTKFDILTYLLETNSAGLFGPAPAPHGYRLCLSLEDAGGKLVARKKAGDALCQEVGWAMRHTMTVNRWRGVFILPPNRPRRYDDTFNVLNCFNVEKSGIYTLHVKGALYLQTSPPPFGVTPIEIPASSLRLVITQSDLDAYGKRIAN